MAWNDFGAPQFPSGEALKLAIASGLELDDLLKRVRLLGTAAGFVELLTPAARRAAGVLDTSSSGYPHLIDLAHALMLVYQEEGERAAMAFLSSRGREEDPQLRDLIQALLLVVPRDRGPNRKFLIPEAEILEDLRLTIFSGLAAPIEVESAVQLELVTTAAEDADPGVEG